jgi:HK97 family phage major capsid protein
MAAVSKDELRTDVEEKKARIEALNSETEGARFTAEQRDEDNRLNTEIDEIEEHISELVIREERAAELAGDPKAVEKPEPYQFGRKTVARGEDIYDLTTVDRSWDDPSIEGNQLRDRAKRAVEQATFPNPYASHEDAQGNIERLISTIDNERGDFSRYLVQTGSEAYKRAFTKYLSVPPEQMGAALSPREQDMLYRAASLTTTAGGFAVPFVLDPSVIQTGSGALNPYRDVGNVTQINVDEWRGVSSAGITATFQAEAAAVTDASPTLAQPVVSTEMARAFVPFSIEIGQDWGSFASEMATMIGDSKDVLEATKFAVGSGTNEPFGVVTGATTVYTAVGTNVLAVGDIYGVRNALGPRFRGRASWTLNNAVADKIRQFDTAGGASLWIDNIQMRSAANASTMTDTRLGADLLGHPAYEASAQSGTFTTGQLIGVFGDFSYYKIIDRVGLTIETIPHIFGAAQGNLPTGQRGLFAYWRVGAKVLDANAFRTLKLA